MRTLRVLALALKALLGLIRSDAMAQTPAVTASSSSASVPTFLITGFIDQLMT